MATKEAGMDQIEDILDLCGIWSKSPSKESQALLASCKTVENAAAIWRKVETGDVDLLPSDCARRSEILHAIGDWPSSEAMLSTGKPFRSLLSLSTLNYSQTGAILGLPTDMIREATKGKRRIPNKSVETLIMLWKAIYREDLSAVRVICPPGSDLGAFAKIKERVRNIATMRSYQNTPTSEDVTIAKVEDEDSNSKSPSPNSPAFPDETRADRDRSSSWEALRSFQRELDDLDLLVASANSIR